MIIFNLDGCLADCEHRRHFVEKEHKKNIAWITGKGGSYFDFNPNFKPDWQSYNEACDKDQMIEPVVEIWNQQISLGMMDIHQIWSGRCESARDKTEYWLDKHLLCFNPKNLKLRPIGDTTPDHELKEKWLDEYLYKNSPSIECLPDFVFESDPKSKKMWRRRGIFVFDVNQKEAL